MDKLLQISEEELALVIQNTSEKLNLSTAIIEKDFWVCVVLRYLFSEFKYKNHIVFKGGTSLSKVYGIIDRFSEDIDLALNWELIGYGKNEPYEKRSNTKQAKFNEMLNTDTKLFLKDVFLPILVADFAKLLPNKQFRFYIDELDGQTICFDYPKKYSDTAILQVIRLEIGCLAEPIPASMYKIKPYISEAYPNIFSDQFEVYTVECIRTFYEKITILHREANRVNGNYPMRYSRHYYDVYKLLKHSMMDESLENIEVLFKVVDFKKKFYPCNWAKYDEIKQGNIKLIPSNEAISVFESDFQQMKQMIFRQQLNFNQILDLIKKYERLLNDKIKSH
ncbi:nucleotidyl transferase AbiEii/AbiGii toxin family protein [Enterococcus cecorum]|uniref:nucleotidyl transferase AbiEii/AbiGii toxin family protein n=1 Tax=Enterococcus cecorum TaxID=44008 RepID=UPI0032C4AA67